MQRGEAYAAEAQYPEAVTEFKNAVQLDPQDAQAHYQLDLAYLEQGGLPKPQQTFQSFSRSVQLDPINLEAQLKLEAFHLLARQFDQAQEKAALVVEREPDNIEAHLVLGNAYAGQQKLDDTIVEFHKARELHPNAYNPRST